MLFANSNINKYNIGICTPMFMALFTIAKRGKQPNCPSTGRWISKM